MSLGNLPLSEKKKPQKRLNDYIRDLFFKNLIIPVLLKICVWFIYIFLVN